MTTCKECGHENRKENNYCANCGAPLNQIADKPVSKPPQKPEISSQTKMSIGIIAAVIIVSSIIGAIWWSSTIMNYPGMSEASFTIVIDSDTSWSGAIGGLGSSRTESGTGHASFTIESSIVSAVIQKQTEWGYLTVKILKNSQVLDQQTTTAAYGVVTVSASS